jgi:hypothetical protein
MGSAWTPGRTGIQLAHQSPKCYMIFYYTMGRNTGSLQPTTETPRHNRTSLSDETLSGLVSEGIVAPQTTSTPTTSTGTGAGTGSGANSSGNTTTSTGADPATAWTDPHEYPGCPFSCVPNEEGSSM